MNYSKNKILAVAVCTKRVGVAVFAREELLYYAVKTLKSPRTSCSIKRQVIQIMREIINEFEPSLLIVKTIGKRQVKSKKQCAAVKQVKNVAEEANIPSTEVSLEQIKPLLCTDQKLTKTNAFKTLSKTYPELKRFVQSQNRSQAEYYNSLLSAAAIGFYYQSHSQRNEKENSIPA